MQHHTLVVQTLDHRPGYIYAPTAAGTPMQDNKPPSATDIVRCVATARVTMPRSVVRLSAGRLNFSLTDQVSQHD